MGGEGEGPEQDKDSQEPRILSYIEQMMKDLPDSRRRKST